MREAIEKFRAAIHAAGLEPPDVIDPGKLHRFSTNGKASEDIEGEHIPVHTLNTYARSFAEGIRCGRITVGSLHA